MRTSSGILGGGLAALLVVGAAAQQTPDRSKAPATGPAPVLKVPPIQKRALANGLPVWVVEMHEVPVVDVTLIVKSGASADPPGSFGLASLTADMLDEGAGARTALELADAIDFLGASLSTGSGFDASNVRLHALLSKLDQALPLMADVALRPTFPQNELDRVRTSRITSIVQARDSPATLASLAFPRMLWGLSHRYGTSGGGTESSLKEMTVSDLKAFHGRFYQPANAHLLVVGDITADAATSKLNQAFGAWKTVSPVPKLQLPAAPQHGPRQVYLVDKPGAAQSQIRIGWIGVPRNTPDYFPLTVLNTILGGSFTSRLSQNLREQHGYAYGASSGFDMRLGAGPFTASAGVQTDKTAESLAEFFKELDGIHQPIPADELARAKNLEALGFPSAFETTTGMAGRLTELVIYGLPETYFNEYVPKIQAVTAADVKRVADQYLQTNRFAVVVVGDLSKIEQPVRAANLGPVKVVSIEDVIK
jgi:predicted Zn-dependent peptidase